MNTRLKKELDKMSNLGVSYSKEGTVITIPKKKEIDTTVSRLYNIEIEGYIIDEPPGFTLSSNWNNNTVPPDRYMHVEIIQEMKGMIKVRGVGLGNDLLWEGWLPKKAVKIL